MLYHYFTPTYPFRVHYKKMSLFYFFLTLPITTTSLLYFSLLYPTQHYVSRLSMICLQIVTITNFKERREYEFYGAYVNCKKKETSGFFLLEKIHFHLENVLNMYDIFWDPVHIE